MGFEESHRLSITRGVSLCRISINIQFTTLESRVARETYSLEDAIDPCEGSNYITSSPSSTDTNRTEEEDEGYSTPVGEEESETSANVLVRHFEMALEAAEDQTEDTEREKEKRKMIREGGVKMGIIQKDMQRGVSRVVCTFLH
jgi:hypothetical protein